MNSIKIEKSSILSLKNTIVRHSKMNDFINDNDKEPSWDGEIYLYSSDELKVEDIQYRVPVQVKGKNDESLLNRERISYPIEYKNLRNYYQDGGVCYFVIIISDDGEQTSIFYNALTPIKLKDYLKGTESKNADQTKNIILQKLKNNNSNELYKILMQFGHDSGEQGTGELIRKSIDITDLDKIDSIRMTGFVTNTDEMIQGLSNAEICLFGHRADSDIWLPFSYKEQQQIKMIQTSEIEKTFAIDGTIYYDRFKMEKGFNNTFSFRLSDNLLIDIINGKIDFNAITSFDEIKKDIMFLKNITSGNTMLVDNNVIATYGDVVFPKEMQENIKDIELVIEAFETLGITCTKRVEEFTDVNWKSVNKLVNIHSGKIVPKKESAWHIWEWDDRILPILLIKKNNKEVNAYNIITMKELEIKINSKGKTYRFPSTVDFKRDVWENLYEFEEDLLLDDIECSDFNEYTEGYLSLMLMEILSAYDTTQNEVYYNLCNLISKKLLEVSPENEYWIINKLQLIKRKRELCDEELLDLEKMEQVTENKMVESAVNILLENKRKAKRIIDEMSKEDKELFCSYPIYNLL